MKKQFTSMQNKRLVAAAGLLSLVPAVLTGCNWPQRSVPGSISSQRQGAVLYDPFPSNELGPPITGVRPRGFDQPLSEARQLQSSPFARNSQRGAPVNPNFGF